MDAASVKQKLFKVLQEIQLSSGLDCPVLTGNARPIENLPEFDSKMWPVATALLAKELGITIADDINIFREDHIRRALTVDETIAVVMKVAKSAPATESTAAVE